MRPLAGHPVLAYTIAAAQQSGVFAEIVLCSDDEAAIAYVKGPPSQCSSWWREPVADTQADIVWIREVLSQPWVRRDAFAILRPTSPFRTAETIRRAFRQFTLPDQTCDSLRAVEPVRQHPGKMWQWTGPGYPMTPLLDYKRSDGVPWHSCPTQTLPTFYVQNSSLEMAWTANIETHGTIHGRKVVPFLTEGLEGCVLDYPEDWDRAVALVEAGAVLPPLSSPLA